MNIILILAKASLVEDWRFYAFLAGGIIFFGFILPYLRYVMGTGISWEYVFFIVVSTILLIASFIVFRDINTAILILLIPLMFGFIVRRLIKEKLKKIRGPEC